MVSTENIIKPTILEESFEANSNIEFKSIIRVNKNLSCIDIPWFTSNKHSLDYYTDMYNSYLYQPIMDFNKYTNELLFLMPLYENSYTSCNDKPKYSVQFNIHKRKGILTHKLTILEDIIANEYNILVEVI